MSRERSKPEQERLSQAHGHVTTTGPGGRDPGTSPFSALESPQGLELFHCPREGNPALLHSE